MNWTHTVVAKSGGKRTHLQIRYWLSEFELVLPLCSVQCVSNWVRFQLIKWEFLHCEYFVWFPTMTLMSDSLLKFHQITLVNIGISFSAHWISTKHSLKQTFKSSFCAWRNTFSINVFYNIYFYSENDSIQCGGSVICPTMKCSNSKLSDL